MRLGVLGSHSGEELEMRSHSGEELGMRLGSLSWKQDQECMG